MNHFQGGIEQPVLIPTAYVIAKIEAGGKRARIVMLRNGKNQEAADDLLLQEGYVAGELTVKNLRWQFKQKEPAEQADPNDPNIYTSYSMEIRNMPMNIDQQPGECRISEPHHIRVTHYEQVAVNRDVYDALPEDLKGFCPNVQRYISAVSPERQSGPKR